MKQAPQYKVTFQHVEPDIEPVDFEGVHLILRGPLAWFWRLFKTMECEEAATRELWPWLVTEKKRTLERQAALANKSGALTPENAAPLNRAI